MSLLSPPPETASAPDHARRRAGASASARRARRALLATVFVLLSIASTRGDVLIDNLNPNTGNGYTFGSTNEFSSGFTLSPSATNYTFDDVVFSLTAGSDAQFVVYLQANSGGNPGTLLATLTHHPQSGTGNYIFRPDAPFTLLAGTTYWLTVDSLASGAGAVRKPPGDNPPMTLAPGVTYEGLNTSTNEGGTWSGASVNDALSFQLNAAPVPEPAVTGLILLGISLLGYRKLRRRRD